MYGGTFHNVLSLVCLCAQGMSRSTQDFSMARQLSNTIKNQGLRGLERSEVSIAVVGSGPISEADRVMIGNAKEIYRFNSMNNLRRDEEVGTVFLRRGGYKGDTISGLPPSSRSCPLIEHADALLIIMDPGPGLSSQRLHELRSRWPRVDVIEESPIGILEIDGERVWPNTAGWSSGFVGVAHVLKHSPLAKQGHKVHVFGMNWKHTSVHSGGHPWLKEKGVLVNTKSVVVHPANSYNYKPRNSTGKMMWMCEGGYSFHLRNKPLGKAAIAATDMYDRSFGLESNDDGTFAILVSNTSSRAYLAGDGRLTSDKAHGMTFGIDDIQESFDIDDLSSYTAHSN
mmetsp:Transcript_59279/g.94077  ORF Transcript_59279/g.94077 Transcript_59279/m.94077 type:complete len:341 (+) Transcript_59279:61-1083(+)